MSDNAVDCRRRVRGFAVGVFLLLVVASIGCEKPWSMTLASRSGAPISLVRNPDAVTPVCASETEADRELQQALEQPAELQFSGVSLREVLRRIGIKYHLPIECCDAACFTAGIDLNQTVDADQPSLPLRTSLKTFLRRYKLVPVVVDGTLWVTTFDDLPSFRTVRVYPVEDLVIPANDPTALPNFDSLVQLVTITIESASWMENGGVTGSIVAYEGNGIVALIIGHTPDVHNDVVQLLTLLREGRTKAVQDVQAKRNPSVPPMATLGGTSGGFGSGMGPPF